MRIEKISDKQIRCTLTPDDLNDRHLNISELAYGSEKARSLFREMLSQASRDFNFHADNIPLMIEAVPMSGDGIVLLITKVEDPEELDTRFSRFSAAVNDDEPGRDTDEFPAEFDDIRADEIIEEIEQMCGITGDDEKTAAEKPDFYHVYAFSSLEDICQAARALQYAYDADNSLYKDESASRYYLVLHKGLHSPQTFNKVCNIMSEYGSSIRSNAGTEAFYREHCKTLIDCHALQSLQKL